MTTPAHEAVAQRAYQNWLTYGSPTERHTQIWLEAERQLAADSLKTDSDSWARESSRTLSEPQGNAALSERIKSETAAESVVEFHITPAIAEEGAIKAALQKQEARAPVLPHHTGPKAKPVESGKPLWNQPHSS